MPPLASECYGDSACRPIDWRARCLRAEGEALRWEFGYREMERRCLAAEAALAADAAQERVAKALAIPANAFLDEQAIRADAAREERERCATEIRALRQALIGAAATVVRSVCGHDDDTFAEPLRIAALRWVRVADTAHAPGKGGLP